ncbi:MAG: hypothetical protein HY420_00985 [Candidatus Kerfeldbacteria bacterium]|nr:hypothetical protein [Candidatus Kerfeldbacteria bacterium]
MKRIDITSGQCVELLTLARRLTPDEYQARHRWLERITDPTFDVALFDVILTPTTYGEAIAPPFADEGGWDLIADGPGYDLLDLTKIRLLPMLQGDEKSTTFAEAVRRSPEFGQRAAFRLRDEGNAGKISLEVFPVNTYAVCGKTQWRRRRSGRRYGLVCLPQRVRLLLQLPLLRGWRELPRAVAWSASSWALGCWVS